MRGLEFCGILYLYSASQRSKICTKTEHYSQKCRKNLNFVVLHKKGCIFLYKKQTEKRRNEQTSLLATRKAVKGSGKGPGERQIGRLPNLS